jgi:hypothetical protein
MKKAVLFLIIVTFAAWWSGCSNEQTPQPSKSHPESWVQATSKEGHGEKVLTSGLESCASCHGSDFTGGTSKVSCFKCHTNYPHSAGWTAPMNSQSHGSYLAKTSYATASCTPCHGEDLQNSTGKTPCNTCHALYPHANGWMQTGNAQFHGAWAKGANWDLTACKTCHGAEFQGGEGKQSCYACHASFPHKSGWLNPQNSQYHGAYLAERSFKMDECKACHGATLQGGDGKESCYTCHASYPHEAGFKYEKSAANFHGVQLKARSYDLSDCSACHGADFKGGTAKASCFKCHANYPHDTDWTDPSATTSHVAWMRGNGHDLTPCKSCHGADYLGGTSGRSCAACHTGSSGPESCTLCHGSADGIQPPKDTQGNTNETAMGVGRHKYHVLDKKYTCILCHTMPSAYGDPGHVKDDTPGRAEIIDLWQWNHATATCVTTCHANDPTKNYIWNH